MSPETGEAHSSKLPRQVTRLAGVLFVQGCRTALTATQGKQVVGHCLPTLRALPGHPLPPPLFPWRIFFALRLGNRFFVTVCLKVGRPKFRT